jgi:hypothetical protein
MPATAMADDLNPAPWRGDPLSVFLEWADEGSGLPASPGVFEAVDDDGDPSTFLFEEIPPSYTTTPGTAGLYTFNVPNFVDELPLKNIRIQITWTGLSGTQPDLQYPTIQGVTGWDSGFGYDGMEMFSSPVQPYTQPDGGYQYHDWKVEPNPDWEQIFISVPDGLELTQVVIDTISIPEPSAMAAMLAGVPLLLRRRR